MQTANMQNYCSWAITSGAESYDVQRSTDGVTYASVATPTSTDYLDTAVTIGTKYWYKVAAVNTIATTPVFGTGSYTTAQSVVPAPTGEMSLGQLRLTSQQRADRVGSNFVTLTEWNSNINQSLFELYDLLVTAYGEDYFIASPATFTTSGSTALYPLPDGVVSFTDSTGSAFVAPALYKLIGVDLGLNTNSNDNGWITLKKFNFSERNKYVYPNTNSSRYGVVNAQYRILGNQMEFIPTPTAGLPIRLWYVPRMTMLLKDTDITTSSVSGWIEYVVIDAAIKALLKEESDVSTLMAQKMALIKRIEAAAMNRDAGQPDTISDTRGTGWGGSNGPYGGAW